MYLILLLFILIIVNLFYYFLILDIKSFDMHINVNNRVGFNVTNYLEFGTADRHGFSSKTIFIENKNYERARVVVKAYGDLKDWVVVSENNFFMNKGDIKELKVDVYVPSDAEYKEYFGKLKIIFLRF